MPTNLKTLLLAATAALMAAAARAETAPATYGHNSTFSGENENFAPNVLFGFKVTVPLAGNLTTFGLLSPTAGSNINMGLYAADGPGGEPGTLKAQTGSFAKTAGDNEHPPTSPVRIPPGDYWIVAIADDSFALYEDFTDETLAGVAIPFTTALPATYPGPSVTRNLSISYYITVSAPNGVIYKKGDAVPGVPGKTFTSFGVPAINEGGRFAFLGKWSGGAGIFTEGTLVAKVGDVLSGTSAIKTFKDPVIDDAGHVAFPCTLAGAGISGTNNAAIVSNAPGGTLAIIAQEGTQAAGAPAGALWKSFTSTAAPGGGSGVIILGYMAQGTGGITAATDNAVWSADSAGVLHLVLQEGTTVLDGGTVKNFTVLKAVSGTPGQTHAHNSNGALVSKVTLTNGTQAVVQQALP